MDKVLQDQLVQLAIPEPKEVKEAKDNRVIRVSMAFQEIPAIKVQQAIQVRTALTEVMEPKVLKVPLATWVHVETKD